MGGVPGVRFLPNAITVLALCSGLTSVAFAMNGQWRLAVGAIAAAAILDSLDGPAARTPTPSPTRRVSSPACRRPPAA